MDVHLRPLTPGSNPGSLYEQRGNALIRTPPHSELLPLLEPVQQYLEGFPLALRRSWTCPQDPDRDVNLRPVALHLSTSSRMTQWTKKGIFTQVQAHMETSHHHLIAPYLIKHHPHNKGDYLLFFNFRWALDGYISSCPRSIVDPATDATGTLEWYESGPSPRSASDAQERTPASQKSPPPFCSTCGVYNFHPGGRRCHNVHRCLICGEVGHSATSTNGQFLCPRSIVHPLHSNKLAAFCIHCQKGGHAAGTPECPYYQLAGEQCSAERRAIADLYASAEHFSSHNLTPTPTPLNVTYFSSPGTSPTPRTLPPVLSPQPTLSWAQQVTSPSQRVAKIKAAVSKCPEAWMTGSSLVTFLETQIEEIRGLVGVRGSALAVRPPLTGTPPLAALPPSRPTDEPTGFLQGIISSETPAVGSQTEEICGLAGDRGSALAVRPPLTGTPPLAALPPSRLTDEPTGLPLQDFTPSADPEDTLADASDDFPSLHDQRTFTPSKSAIRGAQSMTELYKVASPPNPQAKGPLSIRLQDPVWSALLCSAISFPAHGASLTLRAVSPLSTHKVKAQAERKSFRINRPTASTQAAPTSSPPFPSLWPDDPNPELAESSSRHPVSFATQQRVNRPSFSYPIHSQSQSPPLSPLPPPLLPPKPPPHPPNSHNNTTLHCNTDTTV